MSKLVSVKPAGTKLADPVALINNEDRPFWIAGLARELFPVLLPRIGELREQQRIAVEHYASESNRLAFVFDDGGRAAAGFKGKTGDCAVRSIAIATGLPYRTVYDDINKLALSERTGSRKMHRSNSRLGVYPQTVRKYMASLGWLWYPTMLIGRGCIVHLRKDQLPAGRLVVSVSKHFTAVIDGSIRDTHDPSRDGTRCVYGYHIGATP